MPRPPSEPESSETPADRADGDPFDLNLPEVPPGEESLPSTGFSYEARMAHARFLLADKTEEYFRERMASVNPEPFRWID